MHAPEIDPGQGKPECRHLLAYLAEHDAACPVCGYGIRGLSWALCPECGSELRLGVASPRLVPGPWLLAVVSFALALGFDGVVSTMMAVGILISGETAWEPIGLATAFVALSCGMLAGVLGVARSRAWWSRRTVGRQWGVALATFAGVGLAHVFVAAGIALWQS
jgi:hypothetical protein